MGRGAFGVSTRMHGSNTGLTADPPGMTWGLFDAYRKKRTGDEDDNTDCNGINGILQNLKYGALPESFQKTGQFPEYNIIVCISKKITNKQHLTEKIKKYIIKFSNDRSFSSVVDAKKSLPLKETATIYVSGFGNKIEIISAMDVFRKMDNLINGPINNKNQAGNLNWKDIERSLPKKNMVLLNKNFKYSDVSLAIISLILDEDLKRHERDNL